jgi:hypothetical protein
MIKNRWSGRYLLPNCYQKTKWVKRLSRGGLSPTYFQRAQKTGRRSFRYPTLSSGVIRYQRNGPGYP